METKSDGAAYGLRMDESKGRRLNGLVRGGIFWTDRYAVWMCQPVFRWSYNDVWAYITSNDIAYAKTYDKMWEMPESDQRVSYWAGETYRRFGRYAWLKRHYPGLWNKFVTRFPEARGYV
jgi:3'-phosphoadenosine 5'-phosphosulfate sulfotransferase (PAPS reductase)/FAD synthetase